MIPRRRTLLLGALAAPLAAAAGPALPWQDEQGGPNALARAALALLADAAAHGLQPQDYGVAELQRAFEAPAAVPRWPEALSAAMLRLLNDLHGGRVEPTRIRHHYRPAAPAAAFDAEATLRAALALQDVALALRQAAPALPLYARLREALARYRALGDPAAWQRALPALPAPARKVEPGQSWSGMPLLAERLAVLGDLAPHDAAGSDERHFAARVAAVQSFQQRHGLDADGVIGRATWAALQVTPAERARQLALALERLRWTPLLRGPRMIVVNIPEFVLRAYEVQGDGRVQVRLESRVIVGQALDTRTPLIDEDLRHIEFQPYWNVPPSIARKELVPRLRRDPGHWAREGFEFVGADGVDTALNQAKLQAVLEGRQRIRQRPGPRNALGDIKFVFPNRESIYLHHTPSVGLFARARRDFSHGCIRVESPAELAAFALQGLPGWDDPARIRRAMSPPEPPSTVRLASPIPVLIAYGTALVKQGRVHFYEDVYGHDRALDEALRRPRAAPSLP